MLVINSLLHFYVWNIVHIQTKTEIDITKKSEKDEGNANGAREFKDY